MHEVALRVPTGEDALRWCELFDDPEVMRYIGDGSCRDLAYYDDLVRMAARPRVLGPRLCH
jgi:RimJ/RimL family protein N-acetyltransferase